MGEKLENLKPGGFTVASRFGLLVCVGFAEKPGFWDHYLSVAWGFVVVYMEIMNADTFERCSKLVAWIMHYGRRRYVLAVRPLRSVDSGVVCADRDVAVGIVARLRARGRVVLGGVELFQYKVERVVGGWIALGLRWDCPKWMPLNPNLLP